MKKKLFFLTLPFIYLLILLAQQEKAFTQDLGRHLKTGEIIVKCLCVPKTNLFSFTEPNHLFINHHWLSEVVFYALFTYLGPYSLIFLKIVLVLSAFGIVYMLAVKKSFFWATVSAFPYIYILSERFDLRPELFSFLFLSLFVYLIHSYRRTEQVKYLFPLLIIEVLWVNMHIYFIIGIIFFLILVLEQFTIYKDKIDKKLIIITLLAFFSICINPNGIRGAAEPFLILQNYGYSIVENQNIFFLNTFFFNPHVLVFEVVSVLFAIGLLISIKKQPMYSVFLSLFATVISYQMIRNFPIFVFITFPILLTSIVFIEAKIKVLHQKQVVRGIAALSVTIVTAIFVITAVTSPFFGFSYLSSDDRAIEFFKSNNIKGPVFNNFDIGSYLIFKLYPREKVFVDGRPEAYSVAFFDQYKKMQENPDLFQRVANKYTINSIFFAHSDITPWAQTFLDFITKNPDWKTVYLDERIIILVKNTQENQALITQYQKY